MKKAVAKALLAKKVAKSPGEILRVALTSKWMPGRYNNAPYPKYRKVTAAVLWKDTNGDGFCRYTSDNLHQDAAGKRWSKLLFQSLCLNCGEGDVSCPKK